MRARTSGFDHRYAREKPKCAREGGHRGARECEKRHSRARAPGNRRSNSRAGRTKLSSEPPDLTDSIDERGTARNRGAFPETARPNRSSGVLSLDRGCCRTPRRARRSGAHADGRPRGVSAETRVFASDATRAGAPRSAPRASLSSQAGTHAGSFAVAFSPLAPCRSRTRRRRPPRACAST